MVARARWRSMSPTRSPYVIKQGGEISPSPFQDLTDTKFCTLLAQAAMAQRDTSVSDLCKELGIERVTLYRYVGPKGELRDHGKHVLGLTSQLVSFRKLSHLRASSEN